MNMKELCDKIEMFGKDHPTYWGCALAGECGELCNLLKKQERDGKYIVPDLKDELADVFIYTALIARIYDVDLETIVLDKIQKVKERRKAH